jgi:SecD/SecF fusion protein
MKLKGLVWFFTAALTLLSLWELSYTWAVRNFEANVKTKAAAFVKKNNAGLNKADFDAAVEQRVERVLDSSANQKIYLGTTYEKCKANELSLGLDLQGGMSLTMDVSLEDLLAAKSNNPKDAGLLAAIATANAEKANSNDNFVTLFSNAYVKQNGPNKLAGLFSGAGKDIKATFTDAEVIAKLQDDAKGAIKETYNVIGKRIDKFGVAQPNINLDENRGVINVELAGKVNPERVEKLLSASAKLQFFEVYRLDNQALATAFTNADKVYQNYLNGVKDTAKIIDTSNKNNENALFKIMYPNQPQQDKKTGEVRYASSIANVMNADVNKVAEVLAMDIIKNQFPADVKFAFGTEEADKDGKPLGFKPVYALKTKLGTGAAALEGDVVESASQTYDDKNRAAVSMNMDVNGSKEWARLTTANVNKPFAIVLDDIVYSAPDINEPILNGSSQISGSFSVEQAQDLANTLKSGRVKAQAKVVAKTVVGPTLGEAAVKGGRNAFLISFAVIFLLMIVYYNSAGIVANIALILNLLFTVGVLAAFGATLTAAGIAGLVLTIGMAVDTNVIIFERIKEELQNGKSPQEAVAEGYKRSLPPVIDAHVTTFLTALILFYFGLGAVLGFATTQMLGIVLSLLCGILVSRLVTETFMNKNRHFNYFTGLSKRIFKHANFKFIEYRKVAYIISIVVLLAGVGAILNGFDQGVEFKGGNSFVVKFPKAVNQEKLKEALTVAFEKEIPVIKTEGGENQLNITTSYLKNVNNSDSLIEQKLFEGLKGDLPAGLSFADFKAQKYIQSHIVIKPSISDDLKAGAVKATFFALLIIFLYILVRFRDWRYSAGTIVALLHDVLVTLAVFSFCRKIVPFPLEIDQHFIAAVLTVIGFSMNDTVIVFDRVREYAGKMVGESKANIINRAINDTLSRTIMTSLTVFLTILILFLVGSEVTKGFAFAMLVGVITGTYSSIFVAAPILVDLAKDKPLGVSRAKTVDPVEEALAAKAV